MGREKSAHSQYNLPKSLNDCNYLKIDQDVNWFGEVTRFTNNAKFGVRNVKNEPMFYVEENGTSTCNAACYGTSRDFKIDVYDALQEKAMQFKRTTVGCCCCKVETVEVMDCDGTPIGVIKHKACTCVPTFNVFDNKGNEIYRCIGPCCLNKRMFEAAFDINEIATDKKVGCILKTCQMTDLLKEAFTNADNYVLRMDRGLKTEHKAMFLAMTVFIDFAYFESHSSGMQNISKRVQEGKVFDEPDKGSLVKNILTDDIFQIGTPK